MARCKPAGSSEDKPVVRTGGEIFSDGSQLELVRMSNGELSLLPWNGKSAKPVKQFVRNGQTLVPLPIDPTVLRFLHLPSGTADYGCTRELFGELAGLISQSTQEVDDFVQLLTFFVFATWMIDFLPSAPSLWIVCPPTATAAPLAQLLPLLCRRALAVNDILSRGLVPLTELRPVIMTDVFRPTRGILNALRVSSRHGASMAPHGQLIDPRCARVVFANEPLRDLASAGFPLELVLSPARDYVPLMSAAEAERIAAQYQPKLLRYRLLNSNKVRMPAFDLNQLTPCMRDTAYSLGACIIDDDELQAQLLPLLKPVDSDIRVGHTSLLTAIVLEVLLAHCHAHTGWHVPVTELTGGTNTLLLGRGETIEVSPEKVGWVLRALGLHTDFLPGGRKGLLLSQEVREKIHKLAAAHGVCTLRERSPAIECTLCAALVLPWRTEADSSQHEGTLGRQTS